MNSPEPVGQWPEIARRWAQLGTPLRPTEEDLAPIRSALASWCAAHPGVAPRGLILGVTPELYELPWPDRDHLRAVDRTPEMIAHVWPGSPSQVLRSDWRSLPLEDGSVDIALCDGGLHLLDFPSGQAGVLGELARTVAPGGLVILRLFALPAAVETVDGVLTALFSGAIRDLNCLKLRLGMALQESPESGVVLDAVWRTLHEAAGDWPGLAQRLSWNIEHLLAIDAYRGTQARYHFVAEAAVVELASGDFELASRHQPDYVLGERCPTLALRRTGI